MNPRALREELGLTREALAEALGVSVFTVGRLERGEHVASGGDWTATARAFADWHGLSPSCLWPEQAQELESRAQRLEIHLPPEDPEERVYFRLARSDLLDALKKLGDRDACILVDLALGRTLEGVGREAGLTRQRVLQIRHAAVQRMKQALHRAYHRDLWGP